MTKLIFAVTLLALGYVAVTAASAGNCVTRCFPTGQGQTQCNTIC